ncbi:MAG: helix-turn-helix transcriptional regulator [Tannerella sp.]|jgi:transcriptional regulator with XRE-family HTH domain|nr:helix-turn-helix transcriptional regulator [Tannerella sp.]
MEEVYENVHHGHSVKQLRNLLGVKQHILAESLGLSQASFSRIESQEIIEDGLLQKIAMELKIPVDLIKNFSEESAIKVMSNEFKDNSSVNCQYKCTINPIERVVELYERMLKDKDEQIKELKEQIKRDRI